MCVCAKCHAIEWSKERKLREGTLMYINKVHLGIWTNKQSTFGTVKEDSMPTEMKTKLAHASRALVGPYRNRNIISCCALLLLSSP